MGSQKHGKNTLQKSAKRILHGLTHDRIQEFPYQWNRMYATFNFQTKKLILNCKPHNLWVCSKRSFPKLSNPFMAIEFALAITQMIFFAFRLTKVTKWRNECQRRVIGGNCRKVTEKQMTEWDFHRKSF